jgi:hypothetical protein
VFHPIYGVGARAAVAAPVGFIMGAAPLESDEQQHNTISIAASVARATALLRGQGIAGDKPAREVTRNLLVVSSP